MSLFHVIKYPISEIYGIRGINGTAAIDRDLPELYAEWMNNSWMPFVLKTDMNFNISAKEPVDELRRMLLELDEPL